MHIFKKRLERYKELIEQGDIAGAIKRIKRYDYELLSLGSSLGKLLERIHTIDSNMKFVLSHLSAGKKENALNVLNSIIEIVDELPKYIKKAAEEEKKIT